MVERRRIPRPCPAEPGACWYQGGICQQCISEHLREVGALADESGREEGLDAADAHRIAARFTLKYARTWGGDRPYVSGARQSDREARNSAIRHALDTGATRAEVARRFGLSLEWVRQIGRRR